MFQKFQQIVDLQQLCEQLGLPQTGLVKDLKSRLTKKLKKGKKTSVVKTLQSLAEHFKNHSVLCISASNDGRIQELSMADNITNDFLSVTLDYQAGIIKTILNSKESFPQNLSEVKLLEHQRLGDINLNLAASSDHLLLFDDSFTLLKTFVTNSPIVDMTPMGDKILFIEENVIKELSLTKLSSGIFEAVHLTGNASTSNDLNGSSLSASFQSPSSICCYQNSIIVETTNGKVKIISDIEDIKNIL